jgi:hypothetical protein
LSDTDDIELYQQSHLTKNMMSSRFFISVASYFLLYVAYGIVGQTLSDTTGISLGTYNAKTSSFSKCQLLGSDYYNPVSLSCKVHDSNSNQDVWIPQIAFRNVQHQQNKESNSLLLYLRLVRSTKLPTRQLLMVLAITYDANAHLAITKQSTTARM